MDVFKEKTDRIKAAINLEKTDRIPLILNGVAFNAAVMGVSLADFFSNAEFNCTCNLEAVKKIAPHADAIGNATFDPNLLPLIWASEVKVPGNDLPNNELWQMNEKELIKQSDYDEILEIGYENWYEKFMVEKLGNPFIKLQNYFNYLPTAAKRARDAGYPEEANTVFASPFELFCGGRSLQTFLVDDLLEIPEKVEAVFKLAQEATLRSIDAQLNNPGTRPLFAWVGGWRGTPSMLSPALFERFSFKYFREIVDLVLSYDVVPFLHLDSKWDLGLERLLKLPKKKCLLMLDGATNIFKAKEILGNHMCIKGDVPATMLAYGKPEEVSSYCQKLIKEIGPTGYIMSSGCDIPFNAKIENVKTMADSVLK